MCVDVNEGKIKGVQLTRVSNFAQKDIKMTQISCFDIFFILLLNIDSGFLFNSFSTKRFII